MMQRDRLTQGNQYICPSHRTEPTVLVYVYVYMIQEIFRVRLR